MADGSPQAPRPYGRLSETETNSPAVPPPSGSPDCRYCGRPMTKGFVHGEVDRQGVPATIAWFDPETNTGGRLAPIGLFAWSESPRFPAFICGDCGVIEFRPAERPRRAK